MKLLHHIPSLGPFAVEAMISEQNTALSLGVDVKLVVHQEDEQDRQALRVWPEDLGWISWWRQMNLTIQVVILSSGPIDMEIHYFSKKGRWKCSPKSQFLTETRGFFSLNQRYPKDGPGADENSCQKALWCARECLGNPFAMGLIRGCTIRDSETWEKSLSINPCAIRLFVLDYFVGKMHPACDPWSIWTGAGEAFPTFWRTEYEGKGGAPWELHGNFIETSDSLMLMR